MQSAKDYYNKQYTNWVPWVEDKVLGWWGENKTSYTAKDTMKTRVTGDENLNKVQDGVAEGVGGQFGKGGLLAPVGEASSKEGMNRAERGDTGPVDKDQAQGVTGQLQSGVSGAAGTVQSGLGSLTGGGSKEK